MCASHPGRELLLALFLCAPVAARAQDVVYGPDGAPTVVQRKLYSMSRRWEASALFDLALNNPLVDHFGGLLAVSYHPNEWLDLGLEALYHQTALSNLVRDPATGLRANLSRTPAPNGCAAPPYAGCKNEFSNDNQLRAGGFGVVRLAPFYGKLNLASELKVHFQLFALAGAGVASVHRESVNLCAEAGTGACQRYQQSDATKPVGEAGGGFRFYLGQRWSLATEVRAYFFSSSYKEANDVTDPSTGRPRRYLAALATFDAGVAFLF